MYEFNHGKISKKNKIEIDEFECLPTHGLWYFHWWMGLIYYSISPLDQDCVGIWSYGFSFWRVESVLLRRIGATCKRMLAAKCSGLRGLRWLKSASRRVASWLKCLAADGWMYARSAELVLVRPFRTKIMESTIIFMIREGSKPSRFENISKGTSD